MLNELSPVWVEIKKYLEWGMSIIPVRDRDTEEGLAKTPCGPWKKYQKSIIKESELFELMDIRYNTSAVAGVCGQVSGNMIIFDVDCKYKPGAEVEIMNAIALFYPDLVAIMRVHITPSGGLHLLFRCTEMVIPGNLKLASRYATEEELLENPKQKTKCFLETRGEGGYFLLPPCVGYKVHPNFDNPIPNISAQQLESLLALMRSFNLVIKDEKAPSPPAADNGYYSTNPFDDFNFRCDPAQVMRDLGWDEYRRNTKFIWFTRPGKTTGVSLSWNFTKRFFYCFTTSSDLEEGKGYTPANLLAALKYGGDKKALYRDLVNQGYGEINKSVEKKLARQAAYNPTFSLPSNISADAANMASDIVAQMQEQYPFGSFWIETNDDGVVIDRELLYHVAAGLGFCLHNGVDLVRIDGNLLYQQQPRQFFDELRAYIKEEDELLCKDIYNAWEVFIERHGTFTITRLPVLPEGSILEDTAHEAYKFYSNGVLRITADKIELSDFSNYTKLIWAHEIKHRDYVHHEGKCKYVDFINLATATGYGSYIKKCIGFMAHRYKDETTGYIVVCTEMVENPKDGGGSGKNVFCKLLSLTTTYNSKPGSQVKYDEKFLNSWNGERIFCLSDIPKHFDFAFLKEMSTGEGLMKKMFKNEYTVPVRDMPKFLLQTNYGIDIKDGGVKRRIIIVEFTDFFTRCGGVDVHFDCHFPNGWTTADWNGYDTAIAFSIQEWIKSGLKLIPATLSDGMWTKQWQQEFGMVATDITRQNIDGWITMGYVTVEEFNRDCEKYYAENNTPKPMQPSMIKINDAVQAYCNKHGLQFINNIVKREAYTIVRKKWFGRAESIPF